MTTSSLHEELRRKRTGAERERQQALFLAHASEVLARGLDYEQTLQRVARLAVPTLADWCAVDLVDERGALKRVAVEHVDPSKVQQARSFHDAYPPDPSAPGGVKELVELHGGTISASSRGRDQGSTFVVTLPIAQRRPPVA